MLVENLLDVVIVFNQECGLIRHKRELDVFPNRLHFVQANLNVVLF
jgi:hypothetical protein